MDRFLSHFTNRIDAKGRVSAPAPFRQALTLDGFEGVFATPALDVPALDCGGRALLAEIEALLATTPVYSPQRDALATALYGASAILRMDAEGRIVLDEAAKTRLGVTDAAVFVGLGHKFQIWAPARFAAHLEEARARLRSLRAEVGLAAATGASPP